MSLFTIFVRPVPISKVREKYKKTINGIRPNKIVNAKQAVFLDRWVQENFRTEGGKVGGWAPFKYGGRPRKKGGRKSGLAVSLSGRKNVDVSAKLLRDTTRLQHSYLPFHSKIKAGIGSKVKYSKAHDEGDPTRGLPQRRTLPRHSDEDVVSGLKKIYDMHVAKVINEQWEAIAR